MKNIIYIIFIIALVISACSKDFLEKGAQGELTREQVSDGHVESLIISAYSILNGQGNTASNAFNSPASNWSFGDVLSDDAYKGGGGLGDQAQIHRMEIFNTDPQIVDVGQKWGVLYEGVFRVNSVLTILKDSKDLDEATKKQRTAEMKFLRGHFYFELKKIYNRINYVDENGKRLTNDKITSAELWTKIEDDFKAAFEVLPATQKEVGRPTKWAARAYLAKVYIFQEKWEEADAAATDVIDNGGYSLQPNFNEIFLPENDNGVEVVFAIQYSINDGAEREGYNGSIGDRLIPPGGPRYNQYGFLRPSQNLVNAFKTDSTGLPVTTNVDLIADDKIDPRLDHTVGRPGIPYLDLGVLYMAKDTISKGTSPDSIVHEEWPRDKAVYGVYGPKKRVLSANDHNYLSAWPYVNAVNYYIIRYADVLLWKAEAEIELDKDDRGLVEINQIRTRAGNSEVQTLGNGDPLEAIPTYYVTTYPGFSSISDARNALRIERRLEFAHEGHRFFDLVRWKIAAKTMNDYIAGEKGKRGYLVGATFVKGKHEYMPIPQSQVDLGAATQNPGY